MVVVGNAFNILVIALFLARTAGSKRAEWVIGALIVGLGIPAGAAATMNVGDQREWWTIAFPLTFVFYCVVELVVDYILHWDFRATRYLWAYLALFYVAAIAMVGYSFGVHKLAGFLTLATYLIGLFAAWYSYSKVGHGDREKAS
jgi:hypothetical protein